MIPRAFIVGWLLLVVTLSWSPWPIFGQTATPICPGVQMNTFMRSLGDQKLTVSTVVVTPTIPAGTVFVIIDVQTANIRLRDDGGTVTATTGQLWTVDSHPVGCGKSLPNLQFIRDTAATVDAIAYMSFYGP